MNTGFEKAGAGTLLLNQPLLPMAARARHREHQTAAWCNTAHHRRQPIFAKPTNTNPGRDHSDLNNGTLDVNGNNQLVGQPSPAPNPLPYGGGTAASPNIIITNSSATTATFSTNAANSVFSGGNHREPEHRQVR